VVTHPLAMVGWQREITESADRFGALVVGPGLGRNESVASSVQELFRRVDRPMVIDADGLWALGTGVSGPPPAPRVLTPHDGEYLQLTGRPAGDERIEAARFLAAQRSATVLLKGPVTVVSDPDGRCGVISNGDQRLAVAGSGDVLSGLLGALLATGMAPFEASCSAAFLHAKAGSTLRSVGATASDIADAVSGAFDELAPKIVPVPAPRRMSR
jgi:NAD(P)H-hydrate epimerase